MSEIIDAWFHCGRCGSIFLSPMGESKDRRCPDCGSSPSLGYEPQPTAQPIPAPVSAATIIPGKTRSRRRKPVRLMLTLIAAWLLLVVLIIAIIKMTAKDLPKNGRFVSKQELEKRSISAEDLALLDAAIPLCSQNFANFLNARSPEERNQFVISPITTAARMARFYQLNSIKNFDPKTLTLTRSAVLHLPGGSAIETQWKSVTGGTFDALFIKENGEWRLDWDHYVRFSEYPWPLFLVGGGEDRGEFRLLARERLATERRGLDTISVILAAPRLGYAKDIGTQSPEILVPRDSKSGRLLMAAFKLEKDKKRVFGLTLASLNPEDFIRVRATVSRTKLETGYGFEIQEITAAHWYSEASAGIELPADPLQK
jgi:hypothetical protein